MLSAIICLGTKAPTEHARAYAWRRARRGRTTLADGGALGDHPQPWACARRREARLLYRFLNQGGSIDRGESEGSGAGEGGR